LPLELKNENEVFYIRYIIIYTHIHHNAHYLPTIITKLLTTPLRNAFLIIAKTPYLTLLLKLKLTREYTTGTLEYNREKQEN